MPQVADIGSKRLISLAPDAWLRWVTQNENVKARDILTAEFQWLSRQSDVLMQAFSPEVGEFLVLNELQLHYDRAMPVRMRAYIALAEERYRLRVYPVLVNILPPGAGIEIPTRYESECLGLRAYQDYRVINLWEVDAGMVLSQPLPTLLPFVPVLRNGGEEPVVRQALRLLREEERLRELEPLLAFFASFVLESRLVQQIMRWDMAVLRESPWYQEILSSRLVQQIMRWDMAVLRESPWYQEILSEGLDLGLQQGLRQGAQRQLLRVLQHRFGSVPAEVRARLQPLTVEQLEALIDQALLADSLAEFVAHLPSATATVAQ